MHHDSIIECSLSDLLSIDMWYTVDPQFSWVGGKMKIKKMKIYSTIQNSGTVMHFLVQNLKIKNGEQLKHRNTVNSHLTDALNSGRLRYNGHFSRHQLILLYFMYYEIPE